MRLRLLLTSLVVLAVTASSFSYSTFARWTSLPVTFYVNPNNADVSSAAAIAAVQTALNVWNTAGSPFRYVYGGTASDTVNAYDNRNVLFFRNASNGSTIATTYSWWDSSNHLLDSDIIVWDGGFTFFTGTSGCGSISNSAYLEDIATHELGHALGLNHSTYTDATMYPSYGYCSQAFRTLASDDVAAIQSLYGSTGGSSNTAPTVTITSPANGATYGPGAAITLAASASDTQDGNVSATVQWTDNGASVGTGASLQVTPSGTGAHTYVAKVTDSGNLQGSSQVSITVTGSSVPQMSSPTPGSTLAGSSQTFTWTAGSGISAYWLSAGTSVGAKNLFDQGVGSSLTATVTGLPTSGGTVYVRLWWLAGSWGYADYTYTAANTGGGGGGRRRRKRPCHHDTKRRRNPRRLVSDVYVDGWERHFSVLAVGRDRRRCQQPLRSECRLEQHSDGDRPTDKRRHRLCAFVVAGRLMGLRRLHLQGSEHRGRRGRRGKRPCHHDTKRRRNPRRLVSDVCVDGWERRLVVLVVPG